MDTEALDNVWDSPETELAEALADEDLDLLARLTEIRKSRGITQAEIAAAIGITQEAVSVFEKLGNDPRQSTIRRYARALGVMVRHHIDQEGTTHVADSEELWHITSGFHVTNSRTASARNRSTSVTTASTYQPQQEMAFA